VNKNTAIDLFNELATAGSALLFISEKETYPVWEEWMKSHMRRFFGSDSPLADDVPSIEEVRAFYSDIMVMAVETLNLVGEMGGDRN
jgi:hypothetical protein